MFRPGLFQHEIHSNSTINVLGGLMSRKVRIAPKELAKINRENATGKKWVHENGKPIDPEYICKCYDLYKQGRITTKKLLNDIFKGRTLKAVESKVWKIRGRAEPDQFDDPNQEDLFRQLIPQNGGSIKQ